MKVKKADPSSFTAYNGIKLGVGRQCIDGGPLEISKLGEEAKKKMLESIKVSTVSAGKLDIGAKPKIDLKQMSPKRRKQRELAAQKRAKVAEKRKAIKQNKRKLKEGRKITRRKSQQRRTV
ncbi:hypothetical protein GNI_086990 [Gregarina niphandrodes]|uniref:Uncharacterized protein n=1 Tax=Gregarina niphandrodes TaxID=110365 RepID=A0A023B5U5_GRENI|nr:hypothetical protein GNI_086990 [Gregarina niphandrodes]EZG63294.1 hypothetical protein GNI_086990 [Gregarina niphandrodes]|eukprot:XP_011130686.1 hypothetical protein GNI_086990 [Gregarina niphandrodes]